MPDLDNQRQQLIRLLKSRSVAVGDFTLSSGQKSSFYVDARTTTMSAAGLESIGELGLALISDAGWDADVVGGLTLGADPVAYAIALAARRQGKALDAFTIRKQSKTHGTAKRVEGCFEPGMSVVIVEDVITTGGSALEAIRAIQHEGGRVVGVVAVVDRNEGGADKIREAGFDVRAIVSLRDLDLVPAIER